MPSSSVKWVTRTRPAVCARQGAGRRGGTVCGCSTGANKLATGPNPSARADSLRKLLPAGAPHHTAHITRPQGPQRPPKHQRTRVPPVGEARHEGLDGRRCSVCSGRAGGRVGTSNHHKQPAPGAQLTQAPSFSHRDEQQAGRCSLIPCPPHPTPTDACSPPMPGSPLTRSASAASSAVSAPASATPSSAPSPLSRAGRKSATASR